MGLPGLEEWGIPEHLVAERVTNNRLRLPWYLVHHRVESLVHRIHQDQEDSHQGESHPGNRPRDIRQVGSQERQDNLSVVKIEGSASDPAQKSRRQWARKFAYLQGEAYLLEACLLEDSLDNQAPLELLRKGHRDSQDTTCDCFSCS